MEHAPELERSDATEPPVFDIAGGQVLVEGPVPPVRADRVGPADATPLDDVALEMRTVVGDQCVTIGGTVFVARAGVAGPGRSHRSRPQSR